MMINVLLRMRKTNYANFDLKRLTAITLAKVKIGY